MWTLSFTLWCTQACESPYTYTCYTTQHFKQLFLKVLRLKCRPGWHSRYSNWLRAGWSRVRTCWNRGFESHRGHGHLSVVSVVCCQVEVSATSWSLVQRSPIDCAASLCVICNHHEWVLHIYIYDISRLRVNNSTLFLLTWRKWWAPNNASK